VNGGYLIPANTSRGRLIFGLFRPVDLTIFLTGVGVTFILLMILPLDETSAALIAITPALVCSFLVAPIPHYHNVLTLIIEMYNFFTNQQKYVWKGWCFTYESKDEKQSSGGLDQGPTRNQ